MRSWVIEEAAPTPAMRALAGLLGRGARIAGGTQLRLKDIQRNTELVLTASANKNQSQGVPSTNLKDSGNQKITIKLPNVLDQTSEIEADALSQEQIDAAYRRYDERLGGYPPDNHEPTHEQLSALYHIVSVLNVPPFVDFAVFGPHSMRTSRKMKLSGLMLNASGQFFRSEMAGPASYDQWELCFQVFLTAMVMLDFASPAALEGYKTHIKRYAQAHTDVAWALLYQADTRARRELAGKLRRLARDAHESGSNDAFDPNMPWEFVFRRIPLEFQFWHWEF